MTMQGLTQQLKWCRPSTSWARNCSLIPLQPRPCPFRLSPVWLLESVCKRHEFESDDEVKSIVSNWLRHQSKDFYTKEIWNLVHRWEKCVTVQGDYVKKKSKLLSVLEVLIKKNLPYLLNDPRVI